MNLIQELLTLNEAVDPAKALQKQALQVLRSMGWEKHNANESEGVIRTWLKQKPSSKFPVATKEEQKAMLEEFAKKMPEQQFKVSKPAFNNSGKNFFQIKTSEFELSFQNDDTPGMIHVISTKQGKAGDRFRDGYDA